MRTIRFIVLLSFIGALLSCSNKAAETNQTNSDSVSSNVNTSIKSDTVPPAALAESDSSLKGETEVDTITGACDCKVSAYLNDPDETGTNIRSYPKGTVLKKLTYDPDCNCAIVGFKRAKGNWLELNEGGWVFGPLFAIGTRNYREDEIVYLYEKPDKNSKKVQQYYGEQSMSVESCNGDWMLVKDKKGNKGWLEGNMICESPLTTCP